MFFGKKKGKGAGLENSLKNEQAKSDIILASIDDGVVLVDAAGTIQLFNPAAEQITGWAAKDAIGLDHQSVLKFVNDKNEPYPPEKNPLNKALQSKTVVRDNDGYLKTHSEKTISVAVSVSPLAEEAGRAGGAAAVFRDVSEERQEEKQRTEFISTASHEMRTPVAAIEGYLALALNEKVAQIDAKARDYLVKAHLSTVHLGNLFQDLLTAAKSEDGRLSNHPVIIELGDYLQQMVSDLRFTAEKKGLSLDFLIGGSEHSVSATDGNQKVIRPLYYVNADPERLREVITNLFDNAIKYSEKGRIIIGLTGNEDVAQFRVSDTGQGIPAEDIPHLFQKFYRVDNSATRIIGGTGLGLFICRKIVELYNGRIWVDSKLGEGSTFYINLPRISSTDIPRLQQQAAATVAPTTPTNAGPSPAMIQ
jgi:PAS domain S-box-containing protein